MFFVSEKWGCPKTYEVRPVIVFGSSSYKATGVSPGIASQEIGSKLGISNDAMGGTAHSLLMMLVDKPNRRASVILLQVRCQPQRSANQRNQTDWVMHPDNLPPYALGHLDFWWYNAEEGNALRASGALK